MKRDNWVVGDYGIRPLGDPNHCFYCGQRIGENHKEGCAIREKTVVLDCTIRIVMDVPEFWDVDQIEFHYNDGSWCADNLLNFIQNRNSNTGRCLCDCTTVKYVRDATNDDEDDWGDVRVLELKS